MSNTLRAIIASSLLASCSVNENGVSSTEHHVQSLCDVIVSGERQEGDFEKSVTRFVRLNYGFQDKKVIAEMIQSLENSPQIGLQIRGIGAKYLPGIGQHGDGKELSMIEHAVLLSYLTDIYIFMIGHREFRDFLKEDCEKRSV